MSCCEDCDSSCTSHCCSCKSHECTSCSNSCCNYESFSSCSESPTSNNDDIRQQLDEIKEFISDLTRIVKQNPYVQNKDPQNKINRITTNSNNQIDKEILEIDQLLSTAAANHNIQSPFSINESEYLNTPTTSECTLNYTPQCTLNNAKITLSNDIYIPDSCWQGDLLALHSVLISLDLTAYMDLVEQVLDEATKREMYV